MKSRIAFCLVMLMLFSAVLPLHAEYELPILIAPNPMTAQQFTDLPDDADAREAVLWAFDNGIVNGTAKGVFSPDMICSRAQAACMLYRLEGTPTFMNNNCFADVAEGSWYEKAVIWAAGKGIILGYDDGLFHPEDDLTREQFVTMLYRYAQYLHNYRWIAMDSFCGDPANFADTAEISDFAEDAYTWAISRYIFDKGTALAPKALCTRADAVSLIYRCFPYADADNWAYLEADKEDTDADVFFVNPTVFMGENPVWDYYDEATMSSFVGSINMEKGIYEENTRFFAPYYHQASFSAYYLEDTEKQTEIFEHIYAEVRESFVYYLENYNEGRPIILAGFSQGADMSIRLLKDCFKDENLQKQLIACYAIGWRITEEEMEENPHIRFAECADDTGVLIAFNTEDPAVSDSLLIPAGVKTLAINPLTWTTDGVIADKSLNTGACFTGYKGQIKREYDHFTGAYIDPVRGALKVTDVDPSEYPGKLFDDGIYHLYDYQFFFRNLQENVKTRIAAYLAAAK